MPQVSQTKTRETSFWFTLTHREARRRNERAPCLTCHVSEKQNT